MIRIVVENVLLFLLPSAMYFGYILLTRRSTASPAEALNDAPLVWLFVAGALLVAATFVYYATITPGGDMKRVYVPPHMKDGQIEPGQLK